jgi:polyhydroxyalkanoate synthesis regulator phasin
LPPAEEPPAPPIETSEVISDALADGKITPADAEAVVDSLMEDGKVTEAEATALIETLSDGGALTQAEEGLIIDALSADGEITQKEVNNLSETLSADGKFTTAEKELVAEALIESAEGQAVTVESIAEAGITLEDLPAEQPVEVRQDENGNEVVITAEVAVALELLTSAADIVSAIFESPGQLLFAIGNLGADMSTEEREEASKTIIAATIVGNIATTTIATAIGGIGYRRPN